jgi:hypothetical protein
MADTLIAGTGGLYAFEPLAEPVMTSTWGTGGLYGLWAVAVPGVAVGRSTRDVATHPAHQGTGGLYAVRPVGDGKTGRVVLTWSFAGAPVSYRIYRRVGPGDMDYVTDLLDTDTASPYDDPTALHDVLQTVGYQYVVGAINNAGEVLQYSPAALVTYDFTT